MEVSEKSKKNLILFEPGKSGNPNGRPKGSKSLATYVRELADEDFDWSKIPQVGKKLEQEFGKLGSPLRVIVMKAAIDAMSKGDSQAREWLRKAGWGDKLDVTSDGKRIESPVIISMVQPRNAQPETETTDSS